tara:strand:+ start:311 stop:580 length:270 start_codon:yes stop_codon:yes gene_type:complete
MDYNKILEINKNTELKKRENNDSNWKWLNLKDKEGIKLYAECMRLDERDEEERNLEKLNKNIQEWRYNEWIRDREYRKSMGEVFYQFSE